VDEERLDFLEFLRGLCYLGKLGDRRGGGKLEEGKTGPH
jgi:hypothetical protein